MPAHLGPFERDDVDNSTICGEEREQLRAKFFLVHLVIEVLDIERRIGLC